MIRRYSSSNSSTSNLSISTTTTNSTMNSFEPQYNNRKASRLSNFNPMKNRNVSNGNKPDPAFAHLPGQSSSFNAINASNSPYYNLTPVSTNSLNENTNNYHLTKMETNDSIDSNYSLQQQFKIELNLSKKEIELIRFTWYKMLLDEPVEVPEPNLPIPGGFRFAAKNSLSAQAQQQQNIETPKVTNNITSSLFCRQLYGNLLGMDPKLEKLFPSIKHQAVAFAGVMSFAISQLENLSALNDYLENLGKRHSRILGIEPSMFELMGEALIQTFHERFGNRFNQELEVLWIKLYLFLANSLLQFGIDPVLKLNKGENTKNDDSSLFKLNEVNSISHSFSNGFTSNQSMSSNHSGSKDSDVYSVMDDKRSSVSTGLSSAPSSFDLRKKDKPVNGKKKKRDCVIQ